MTQKTINWIGLATLILALALVGNIFLTPNVQVPTADDIASKIVIDVPAVNGSVDNVKITAIYDELFKDDAKKDFAEALMADELDTRAFKRAVFDALVLENRSIEHYRDIDKFVVTDIDTTLFGVRDENATIIVTMKAYYILDGDDEETEKARLVVEFSISDLEEDDEYDDAEVSIYDINVPKIYD